MSLLSYFNFPKVGKLTFLAKKKEDKMTSFSNEKKLVADEQPVAKNG